MKYSSLNDDSNIRRLVNSILHYHIWVKTIALSLIEVGMYITKSSVYKPNKVLSRSILFMFYWHFKYVKLPSSTKSRTLNLISLGWVKRPKISKQDSDDNASIHKANGKIFKNVSALSKYTETFGYDADCFVLQINAIKHYKLSTLRLPGIYKKIAQKFLNNELWKAAN